nr:MoaD/ThiS family protein [Ramlibacter albus]
MKNYVLDEQGAVRKHVAVFVNSQMIRDRAALDIPLASGDKVNVIQALTGG